MCCLIREAAHMISYVFLVQFLVYSSIMSGEHSMLPTHLIHNQVSISVQSVGWSLWTKHQITTVSLDKTNLVGGGTVKASSFTRTIIMDGILQFWILHPQLLLKSAKFEGHKHVSPCLTSWELLMGLDVSISQGKRTGLMTSCVVIRLCYVLGLT